MSIFIYNHRTNEQIDIPEGYAPIPNDFPVEDGDLTYVSNPFSKPGIVDVLVPGVWVARLGANSWISESISIRPISNKQQLPTIFDYIAASNELADNIMRSYLCDADANVTTQNILEAELQRYLNSEQFSKDMLQSTVALIRKEIEEVIQKRKESVAVPPGKLKLNVEECSELLSPLGAMLRALTWNRETDEDLPKIDRKVSADRNACESCTKKNNATSHLVNFIFGEIAPAQKCATIEIGKIRVSDKELADRITYLFNSIRVSPPLPGHDLARRYFRGKISDK